MLVHQMPQKCYVCDVYGPDKDLDSWHLKQPVFLLTMHWLELGYHIGTWLRLVWYLGGIVEFVGGVSSFYSPDYHFFFGLLHWQEQSHCQKQFGQYHRIRAGYKANPLVSWKFYCLEDEVPSLLCIEDKLLVGIWRPTWNCICCCHPASARYEWQAPIRFFFHFFL